MILFVAFVVVLVAVVVVVVRVFVCSAFLPLVEDSLRQLLNGVRRGGLRSRRERRKKCPVGRGTAFFHESLLLLSTLLLNPLLNWVWRKAQS